MNKEKLPKNPKDEAKSPFDFYTASELKKEQTKLTATATQLARICDGYLGRSLLSYQEQEIINQARLLVSSLKERVTHGKEVRARAEKKRESEKQRQNKFIREIILQNFPAPNKSEPDDMRTTVCLAMALYDADIYLSFFSEIEIVKTMKQQIETYFNYRSDWWIKNLHDDICRALAEHIESQEFNLLRQSAFSPTDELLKIQSRLDAASEKRTEAHEEVLRHLENKFSI